MDDTFQPTYLFADAPRCALPDLRFLALAAGMVVVVVALVIVAVRRLRTW